MSGSGRIDFDSSVKPPTFTESSPRRVVMTVPSTPIQSPRSRWSKSWWTPSPTASVLTNSWIGPSRSWSVAKLSLPWLAHEHQPAGDRDLLVGLGAGRQIRVRGLDRPGRGAAIEAHRIRVDPGRTHRVELPEPEVPLLGEEIFRRSCFFLGSRLLGCRSFGSRRFGA